MQILLCKQVWTSFLLQSLILDVKNVFIGQYVVDCRGKYRAEKGERDQ